MYRKIFGSGIALTMIALGSGCASSHEEGVKSDIRTQWTEVYADVETTTMAAKDVFTDDKLTDISVSGPTKVDGQVSGNKADGTKIRASVVKTDRGSQVSVTVGTVGSPKMGAQYAQTIKQRAEKK